MAGNHTEHYGLNQWQAGDQVLREDFNRDNQKLEGALTGLAGQVAGKAGQADVAALRDQVAEKASQAAVDNLTAALLVVKLREWTVPQVSSYFQLDLSGVDAGAYTGLRFLIHGRSWDGLVGLRLNGVAERYIYVSSMDINDSTGRQMPLARRDCVGSVELYPLRDGTAFLNNLVQASDNGATVSVTGGIYQGLQNSVPYTQIQTVQLVCPDSGATFGAGTKLTLFGLRY